jgi:Rrf2 family iron-sulfur cluster assembly transcriptional regulator
MGDNDLLSNRCVLAIAAVVDVALYARATPVDAMSLEARLHLPRRHLETLLQALVRAKILIGNRGPSGGYQLARERQMITVGEIVRTWKSTTDPGRSTGSSRMISEVIEPALQKAGRSFMAELAAITVEDLCDEAIAAKIVEGEIASTAAV